MMPCLPLVSTPTRIDGSVGLLSDFMRTHRFAQEPNGWTRAFDSSDSGRSSLTQNNGDKPEAYLVSGRSHADCPFNAAPHGPSAASPFTGRLSALMRPRCLHRYKSVKETKHKRFAAPCQVFLSGLFLHKWRFNKPVQCKVLHLLLLLCQCRVEEALDKDSNTETAWSFHWLDLVFF
jgi:hypothetical protein